VVVDGRLRLRLDFVYFLLLFACLDSFVVFWLVNVHNSCAIVLEGEQM
jgi:hypothetical protein